MKLGLRGGVSPTLNAMDNNGEVFATVLIIDGTRVNDVRVYEDGIVPTVISRYGTGGGNVPMVFQLNGDRDNPGISVGEIAFTLSANPMSDRGQSVVYPIDDARELEKHQNGTGIGAEGAPAYTLDRLQAPGIVTASTVRRLTPIECERLQGFPDNWTSEQSDSTRYKQIGNAVAVPVVDWIIKNIIEATK